MYLVGKQKRDRSDKLKEYIFKKEISEERIQIKKISENVTGYDIVYNKLSEKINHEKETKEL